MDKIAIITGANTGLGFETAKALLLEGYYVVMANRNAGKSKMAIKKLKDICKVDHVEYMIMDLEDRPSIEAFVAKFESRFGRFDVLVNNGGALLPKYSLTKNDLERHFDVNYLGHFYLNSLLLDSISDEGLVISLGSLAHKMEVADIHFDDIAFKKSNYEKMKAYSQSKLALTLYGVELARRFEGTNKRSIIVHPGVCNTDIFSRYYGKYLGKILMPIVNLFGISGPKEGAQPIIHAILTSNIPNGSFIGPQGKKEWRGNPGFCSLSDKAKDGILAKKLWAYSEELIGNKFIID
ncbi:MAG: SDR family NAD(P)-dependent oxidoreductase [Firmicutes bacterium]|nr:SDR family NAD(P)-dependent oxidoreductase [Bacillota bacterium]